VTVCPRDVPVPDSISWNSIGTRLCAAGYQMKYSAGTGCSEKCNMFDNKFLL